MFTGEIRILDTDFIDTLFFKRYILHRSFGGFVSQNVAEYISFQGYRLRVARDLNTRLDGEPRRRTRVTLLAGKQPLVAHLPEPRVEDSLEILRQEYDVLCQIKCRGFPRVYGAVLKDGTFAGYVREYIQEHDLFWRRLFPSLTLRQLLRNGVILAFALERFHRIRREDGCAQVMRDIKPHNLCFQRRSPGTHETWSPVFTDFNAVIYAGYSAQEHNWQAVHLTPVFSAPEQVTGPGTVTQLTDQWALGMTIMSVAIGINGYYVPDEVEGEQLHRAGRSFYPYWRLLENTLPPVLCEMLDRATSPLPARRFPSSGWFGKELHALLHSLPREALDRPLPDIPTREAIQAFLKPQLHNS